MSLEKLKRIGFIEIGHWTSEGEELIFINPDNTNYQNALYAFVCEKRVLYIGKTTNSLKKRFYGYIKPSTSQKTNLGNKRRLLNEIKTSGKISIYAFEDKGLMIHGDLVVNLAYGLEKSIIEKVDPEWNGKGNKTT